MNDFERATRNWESECDRVAANLVNQGVSPYDAAMQAREIVRLRRQKRAAIEAEKGPSVFQ